MDRKKVELFGDGSQIRDVNYIDDVIEALLLLASSNKSNNQAYNLGGQPVTLKSFVETVIKILGEGKYKTVLFPNDRKAIEVGNYVADIKKINTDVGWQPKVSIEEGIKKTIEYYQKYKRAYF